MIDRRAQQARSECPRRRSTEEITMLIDWALGDIVVDPSVGKELTRAARVMRFKEYLAIRDRAA